VEQRASCSPKASAAKLLSNVEKHAKACREGEDGCAATKQNMLQKGKKAIFLSRSFSAWFIAAWRRHQSS